MATKKVNKVKRTKERSLLSTLDRMNNQYSYSGRITKISTKNGTTMALIEELRDSSNNEFLSPHIWVEVTDEIKSTLISSAKNKAHMTFMGVAYKYLYSSTKRANYSVKISKILKVK